MCDDEEFTASITQQNQNRCCKREREGLRIREKGRGYEEREGGGEG